MRRAMHLMPQAAARFNRRPDPCPLHADWRLLGGAIAIGMPALRCSAQIRDCSFWRRLVFLLATIQYKTFVVYCKDFKHGDNSQT